MKELESSWTIPEDPYHLHLGSHCKKKNPKKSWKIPKDPFNPSPKFRPMKSNSICYFDSRNLLTSREKKLIITEQQRKPNVPLSQEVKGQSIKRLLNPIIRLSAYRLIRDRPTVEPINSTFCVCGPLNWIEFSCIVLRYVLIGCFESDRYRLFRSIA